MTEVTRHPNCRCGAVVGDNAYCVIHGRIRDMDAGASPFIDVDALAASLAQERGITEEDIDRTQDTDSYVEQMHRDNLERDMQDAARLPYDVEGTAEEITDEDE